MIWSLLRDALSDSVLDTLKVLPFLFLAYLLIELIEHHAESQTVAVVRKAGPLGPVLGALLGVIPQCGFSAATANLYAGGLISRGTLIAVFLSTSDEMLPILVSKSAPGSLIARILLFKLLAGMAAGLLIDLLFRLFGHGHSGEIHDLCEREGCDCQHGVLRSALYHTVKIAFFLLLTSFALNLAVGAVGTERLSGFILNRPVIGELLAGFVGLIPNCAASVVVTQLYLQGGMSGGAMAAGLLVSAGVGLLVLFRMNRDPKDNLLMLALLYASGVLLGLLASALSIFG